jgi:hypothetical protein
MNNPETWKPETWVVELPLFDRTLGYGVWARMNSRGERILSPECGWLSL